MQRVARRRRARPCRCGRHVAGRPCGQAVTTVPDDWSPLRVGAAHAHDGTRSLASDIPWPPSRGKDTRDLRCTNAGSLMSTGSSGLTAQAGCGRPHTAVPGATPPRVPEHLRPTRSHPRARGRTDAPDLGVRGPDLACSYDLGREGTTSAEDERPRHGTSDLGGRSGPSGAPGRLELAPRSRSCGLSPLGRRGRRPRRGGRGPRLRVCGRRRPRVRR